MYLFKLFCVALRCVAVFRELQALRLSVLLTPFSTPLPESLGSWMVEYVVDTRHLLILL